MSLIRSRQPKTYDWNKGDWISATDAAELLGYKSSMVLRDADRRAKLLAEFERLGCALTVMTVGGQYRFLRSEIDAFITAKIQVAQKSVKKMKDWRLAA